MTHIVTSCPHVIVSQTSIDPRNNYRVTTGTQGGLQRYIQMEHEDSTYRLIQNQELVVRFIHKTNSIITNADPNEKICHVINRSENHMHFPKYHLSPPKLVHNYLTRQ